MPDLGSDLILLAFLSLYLHSLDQGSITVSCSFCIVVVHLSRLAKTLLPWTVTYPQEQVSSIHYLFGQTRRHPKNNQLKGNGDIKPSPSWSKHHNGVEKQHIYFWNSLKCPHSYPFFFVILSCFIIFPIFSCYL